MSKYVIIIEAEDLDDRPAEDAKAALTAALRAVAHRDSILSAEGFGVRVFNITARI